MKSPPSAQTGTTHGRTLNDILPGGTNLTNFTALPREHCFYAQSIFFHCVLYCYCARRMLPPITFKSTLVLHYVISTGFRSTQVHTFRCNYTIVTNRSSLYERRVFATGHTQKPATSTDAGNMTSPGGLILECSFKTKLNVFVSPLCPGPPQRATLCCPSLPTDISPLIR